MEYKLSAKLFLTVPTVLSCAFSFISSSCIVDNKNNFDKESQNITFSSDEKYLEAITKGNIQYQNLKYNYKVEINNLSIDIDNKRLTFTYNFVDNNIKSKDYFYTINNLESLQNQFNKLKIDMDNKDSYYANKNLDISLLKIDKSQVDNYVKVKIVSVDKGNKDTELAIKVALNYLSKDYFYTYYLDGFKKPVTPNPINPNISKVRLGTWNMEHFMYNKNSFAIYKDEANQTFVHNVKANALAAVINYLKVDVQGIIELVDKDAIIELKDQLNSIDPSSQWDYVVCDKKENNPIMSYGSWAHEFAGFVYKKALLDLKLFEDKKSNWLVYDNSNFEAKEQTNPKIGFIRPPFGVCFETKGSIKNDFTFVINHFDSPGNKQWNSNNKIKKNTIYGYVEENDSAISGQGAQEADEAYNLINAMNWFDEKDGDNDELIYMGDTNIKFQNEAVAFKNMFPKYKSLLADTHANKTTLSTRWGAYSNPYDKIFYKGSLKAENANKYPLYNFPNDNILDGINSQTKWKEYVDKYFSNGMDYENEYIRWCITDHCPIYVDLMLDPNDIN